MNADFKSWQQMTKTTHLEAEIKYLLSSFVNNKNFQSAKQHIEISVKLLIEFAKGDGIKDKTIYEPDLDSYRYAQRRVKNREIEERLFDMRTMRNYTIQLMDYFKGEGDARIRKGFDEIMCGIKQLEEGLYE